MVEPELKEDLKIENKLQANQEGGEEVEEKETEEKETESKKLSKGQKKKQKEAKKGKKVTEKKSKASTIGELARKKREDTEKEQERIKKEKEEANKRRIEEENRLEEERKKLQEEAERKKKEKKELMKKLKEEGKIMTTEERLEKEKKDKQVEEIKQMINYQGAFELSDKPISYSNKSKNKKKNRKASEVNEKQEKKDESKLKEDQTEDKKENKQIEVDWEEFMKCGDLESTIKQNPIIKEDSKDFLPESKVIPPEDKKEIIKVPISQMPLNPFDESINTEYIEEAPQIIKSKYRCPIICILGHVDTGKTSLLDKIRSSKVQAGEVGGITQQIGASYFPVKTLEMHSSTVAQYIPTPIDIPGLIIIDTPGHEVFSNLRNRGSSLCDLAILVVDLMHGIQKQTIESIQILQSKKIPFVIALNKIDKLYGWKPKEFSPVQESIKLNKNSSSEFNTKMNKVIAGFANINLNAILYWEIPAQYEEDIYLPLIPTSAKSGEGVSDLLTYLVNSAQTKFQSKIKARDENEFICTILEVNNIGGYGMTIDIILVNGVLKVDDIIILSGINGPIVTKIKAILSVHPLKEMRVKNEWIPNKSVRGTIGVKLSTSDPLDNALAGSQIFVCKNNDDIEKYKILLGDELSKLIKKYINPRGFGITIQSSTLGSMEALLELFAKAKIPIANIGLGPLSKRDAVKALKALEVEEPLEEYATILCFEVDVPKEIIEFCDTNKIKVMQGKIVYHLVDQFLEYYQKCVDNRKKLKGKNAIFPCVLKIVDENSVFAHRKPIIVGVNILSGILKVGTPLCVLEKGENKTNLNIGIVESLEVNHKSITSARKEDGGVAIKISGEDTIMVGRHFDISDELVSIISRESIDSLKEFYKDEMRNEDWKLIIQLKPKFGIS